MTSSQHAFKCDGMTMSAIFYQEIADLVEDNQEQYDIVMARGHDMKKEVIEDLNVCASSRVDDMGTHIDYFSLGDGLIPSNQSTNILDPKRVT